MRVLSAIEEASLYHDASQFGYVALLRGSKQTIYPQKSLAKVLTPRNGWVKDQDVWLAQAEFFKPSRKVVHLLRIRLLFADLDTYKMSWSSGRTPEQLAESILYCCAEDGIPEPSLLIFSGRGIQAKWLLEQPLPRQALPRWQACEKYLVAKLADLGADSAATDAARVLRVPGTYNRKSGDICRVVHVSRGLDGKPKRYDFDYLAEFLLPFSREELAIQRQAKAAKKQDKSKAKSTGLKPFSARQLNWDRLEDLRKLVEIRGGIVPEGQRMLFLFWMLNFMLLSHVIQPGNLYAEAAALAAEIAPGWSYRSAELMTLFDKAKAYVRGETIELNGKRWPPLYTPKNDRLIDIFQITGDEQRQLQTIIGQDMAKARDRARDERRRRKQGAIDRQTYEANALAQQKPWEAFGMSRAQWYRMGKPKPAQNPSYNAPGDDFSG
jgi:hypothetical protein